MAEPLDTFIADGTVELLESRPGYREYRNPKLRHREMTWTGWQTITYCLTIDEEAETGCRYSIDSDSNYSGGDNMLCIDDADETEAWIQARVEDQEQ